MKKNALIAPILHKKVGRYPKFSLFVQGHTGQNHFYNPELVLLSTDSLGLSSQMWLCQHLSVGGMGRRARRREKAREGAGTGGSTNSLILPSLAFPSQLSPPLLVLRPAFLRAPAFSFLPHPVTGLGQCSSLGIPAQDPDRSQCLPPKPTFPAWCPNRSKRDVWPSGRIFNLLNASDALPCLHPGSLRACFLKHLPTLPLTFSAQPESTHFSKPKIRPGHSAHSQKVV